MKTINKVLLTTLFGFGLSACSSFFDKDNTPPPSPLVSFKAEATPRLLWYANTGAGVSNNDIKLVPAIADNTLFTADTKGHITATDKNNGHTVWTMQISQPITGGLAAGDHIVVAGCRNGDLFAVDQSNGKALWRAHTTTEILATPAIKNGITVVKTIDGRLTAYANTDGHERWSYQATEPNLILRGSSAPQISGNAVITGFANGELVKLSSQTGNVEWQQTIATPEGAFAIQRMVDIDANPLIFENRIYTATYQGRIMAMNLNSGENYWTHDMSSYTGLTADNERVYVTDASSHVWAFDATSGQVDWRQTELEYRTITAPAMEGNNVIVGDAEGYLHWLNKQDGHVVARVRVNGSGMIAGPLINNGIVYVLTKDGHLAAYTLG